MLVRHRGASQATRIRKPRSQRAARLPAAFVATGLLLTIAVLLAASGGLSKVSAQPTTALAGTSQQSDGGPTVGQASGSCWVPFALFPERRCAEVRLEVECSATEVTDTWDEECAVCRSGNGHPTRDICEARRTGDDPVDTRGGDSAEMAAAEKNAELEEFRISVLNRNYADTGLVGGSRNDERPEEPLATNDTVNFTVGAAASSRTSSSAPSLCKMSISDQLKAHYAAPLSGRDCPHAMPGLLLWHDAVGWNEAGGQPPTMWANVELPERTKVLVTECSVQQNGVFTKVVVPASSQVSRRGTLTSQLGKYALRAIIGSLSVVCLTQYKYAMTVRSFFGTQLQNDCHIIISVTNHAAVSSEACLAVLNLPAAHCCNTYSGT